MWPLAKQLYEDAPLFQALVVAAAAVTAVGLFSSVFAPTGPAQASTVMPIPTGPGAYLSPYPTPPTAVTSPVQIMPSLQAQQPVMPTPEARPVGRALIDTSGIAEAPKARRSPHAVAPGVINPGLSQPRPLIEP